MRCARLGRSGITRNEHTSKRHRRPRQKSYRMTDVWLSSKRSEVMARIRSSGNVSTEGRLIEIFRANKISGWRRSQNLPGKPDFVFPKERLAVFVDGSFWHGHPKHCRYPATNAEFWRAKIEGNKRRDRTVSRLLKSKAWRVIRIWEHDLKADPRKCLRKIRAAIASQS